LFIIFRTVDRIDTSFAAVLVHGAGGVGLIHTFDPNLVHAGQLM